MPKVGDKITVNTDIIHRYTGYSSAWNWVNSRKKHQLVIAEIDIRNGCGPKCILNTDARQGGQQCPGYIKITDINQSHHTKLICWGRWLSDQSQYVLPWIITHSTMNLKQVSRPDGLTRKHTKFQGRNLSNKA